MTKNYYTTGELAKLTGVTYKTIRHYQSKGLISPEKHTESGYRLYGIKSVQTLQRILMLKYLNFSLDDIQGILKEEDTKNDFQRQEELLIAQKDHIEQILKAVKDIQKIDEEQRWESMLSIINMTQQKEEIINQYRYSSNLEKRINIHSYSTSKVDWITWIFEELQLKSGMKIFEIGCGTGMLWSTLATRLPKNLNIQLSDSSENMLKSAKSNIEKNAEIFEAKNIKFTYSRIDAENLPEIDDKYDRIIANHMLYHVANDKRPILLQKCKDALSDKGMFFASTVGKTHLRELADLLKGFDRKIDNIHMTTENFELENGKDQLENIFPSVIVKEYDSDLLVPDPTAVYDYIKSWIGNVNERLIGKDNEIKDYLNQRISKEKPYFIHKSTGAFMAYK